MTRRGFAALVALALVLALLPGGQAEAHAALRASEPAANAYLQRPPREVILDFSEPIDARGSTVRLLDARGAVVATGEPVVTGARMRATLPELAPGIYNVLWSNVSLVDGHAISGSYPFTVLNPDGSVPAGENLVQAAGSSADRLGREDGIAVRWLSLLGLMMVAGAAVILLLWPERPPGVTPLLQRLAFAGIGAAAAATLLNAALLRDTYSTLSLGALLFDTRTGLAVVGRAGALVFAAAAAGLAVRHPRAAAWGLAAAVLGFLWSYTATSHAAAVPGSGWARIIDVLHAGAAVGWMGAVAGAAVAARLARRTAPWRPLLRRFARLASALVFVLLATGLLGALVHIDSPGKLTETTYGRVVLAKLALMVPLLAVALYNARRGKERLAAARRGEPRRFRISAAAELGVGLAVMLAAAVLSQTPTSRSIVVEPEHRPFDVTAPAADLQVRLTVDPNRTGFNRFTARVRDASGQPRDVEQVRLVFRYQEDQSVGPATLVLQRTGEGEYAAEGPYLPLEGRWRVELELRRADADDARTFFDVRPAGALATATTERGGTWSLPTAGLSWNQFAGLAILLAGLGLAFARGALREAGRLAGMAGSTGTMLGVGLGVLLLFGVHAHEPPTGMPTNPIFPDADSIARGRALYEANCIACHGRTGVPPPGLDLNPYPLDLTVHVPRHPDGQIFRFIADGIPGTAMPAWKEQGLSDEEIWHLVNYLRTLAPVTE
ncbi:FixH family protein [Tepidiforma sp.]|uniref:FixH family protein n=1 Tax=Tepidiforma sp. TaxID=2682230 RepID=UPI002ADD8265|nr:FixH family protein [Tepidiforma sp.]